jgi:type I restriction enzyme M protein
LGSGIDYQVQKKQFNLNIPRYIDSQEAEDIQDIEAHLLGGIPNADIDALNDYWEVYPKLSQTLFKKGPREKYSSLKVKQAAVKQTIFEHPEFAAYTAKMNELFSQWKNKSTQTLKEMQPGLKPKEIIFELSGNLLAHYANQTLVSKYDVYQHLMDYWAEVLQDDCYLISAGGWKAETYRI